MSTQRSENTNVAHLILWPCSVLGCADEQVNVASLTRLVQMFPDGEHGSGSFAPTFHPKRGKHPIDHLDVALQLHCYQKLATTAREGPHRLDRCIARGERRKLPRKQATWGADGGGDTTTHPHPFRGRQQTRFLFWIASKRPPRSANTGRRKIIRGRWRPPASAWQRCWQAVKLRGSLQWHLVV